MDAEEVVALLEQNWDALQAELGKQWWEFAQSYRNILADLPDEPEREDLERTVDRLCGLLNRYEYGRGLLHGYRTPGRERLLLAASEVLADQESVPQVCNRLRHLQLREQEEELSRTEQKVGSKK